MVVLVIGCSKQPTQSSSHTPPNTQDSGTAEMVSEPATNAAITNGAGTNDLVAIALKKHTKKAWQNALYKEIETDPDIKEEMEIDPVAGLRTIKAMNNASNASLSQTDGPAFETNEMPDLKKIIGPDKPTPASK
jgi:hypothetical protein